jgi:hypothetical protein
MKNNFSHTESAESTELFLPPFRMWNGRVSADQHEKTPLTPLTPCEAIFF